MRVSGIQYANIELRAMGIIVHVNKGLYICLDCNLLSLAIYNGEYFSIHSNGEYVQFNKKKPINKTKIY